MYQESYSDALHVVADEVDIFRAQIALEELLDGKPGGGELRRWIDNADREYDVQ